MQTEKEITAKKTLAERAVDKMADILQWMRETRNAPGTLSADSTLWSYAKKGDLMPRTNLTDPEDDQEALQDGFYFAATTFKPGTLDQVEHRWLGGINVETFKAHLANILVTKLTDSEIESIRVGAGAIRAMHDARTPRKPAAQGPER
jgi:hypothetical protein